MNHIVILKIGKVSAWLLAIIAFLTFIIAIFTPPLSGPFCQENCFQYPYSSITDRFPRDYFWMFPAMLLMGVYLMVMLIIHQTAQEQKKFFSRLGICLAVMSALLLLADYYIQVTVIQPSLLAGELEGIALLTQYNPHGIFIAIEELGYILMSLSLVSIVPVFSKEEKTEKILRRVLLYGFYINLALFLLVSLQYGLKREYVFECYIITVDFFMLILGGILLSKFFQKKLLKTGQ